VKSAAAPMPAVGGRSMVCMISLNGLASLSADSSGVLSLNKPPLCKARMKVRWRV